MILRATRPPGGKWVLEELSDEELQAEMNRLAVELLDPTRPTTPPTPDFSLPPEVWRLQLRELRR